MRFTHLSLQNWRNFRKAEVPLPGRVFLVGPNASGKSNLLDALRFLRDLADPKGGFQQAVSNRASVSQIRSLHARQLSNVVLDATMELEQASWRYRIEFTQDKDKARTPLIKREEVWRAEEQVLKRPSTQDIEDPQLLTQTHLEQVNTNKRFRPVAEALAQVRYLHLVPQLVRDRERYVGKGRDPDGGDFLDQLAHMQRSRKQTFEKRMRRITEVLRVAVPQLEELRLDPDERGVPHLRGLYKHWRPDAGWQSEDQFSDGTLRLMGLLWALLDDGAPLLLEEPELSLHDGVVSHVPTMMWRLGRKGGRQTIVSTHSPALLSDESIAAEEVVMLEPTQEGTEVSLAATHQQVRALLANGLSIGEAVLPRTAPRDASQLSLVFPE